MTRYYCDRCGKEITYETYHEYVQEYKELHRHDVGALPVTKSEQPARKVLCRDCAELIRIALTIYKNKV